MIQSEFMNKNTLIKFSLIAMVAIGAILSPFIAPIYWDEMHQMQLGEWNLNQYASLIDHVFGTSLLDPKYAGAYLEDNKYHGAIFQTFCAFWGKIAGLALPSFDIKDFITLKHFCVWLVFLIGTCGVYAIAERRLKSCFGGFLAAAMFFFSPRLFGNAFYNAKDLVFLSFFVASVNFILLAAENRKVSSVIWAALFTALSVGSRAIGIFSLFLGAFVWFVSWHRDGWNFRKLFGVIGGFVALTLLLIYAFFPILWHSPIREVHNMFSLMSHYSIHTDGSFLNGKFVRSSQDPFYLLHWMVITLPFTFIAASLCGALPALALIAKRTCRLRLWKDQKELCDYVMFGLGFAPVLMFMIKPQWIYDGWRHFYFLVPFLAISATVGVFNISSFFARTRARNVAAGYLGISVILESLIGVVWFFPYPNCYFNAFAGHNLTNRYDVDIQGTAMYDALFSILSSKRTISKPIKVSTWGVELALPRLGIAGKTIVKQNDAPEYIIGNDRDLARYNKQIYREVSDIKTTGGEVILRILSPIEKRD